MDQLKDSLRSVNDVTLADQDLAMATNEDFVLLSSNQMSPVEGEAKSYYNGARERVFWEGRG